jgi:phage terminase large subunit-like protein
MKARAFADEEQLITKAVDVLVKELGPIEAGRFLALPKKKRIESVKRHRQWQNELQREQFFNSVFGARSRGAVRK